MSAGELAMVNGDIAYEANILIVDDTPENIDLLSDILGAEYKVMAATSGKKALQIARTDPAPDLILLDVMMPEMDGYETCRQLKSDPDTRNIDVIFVSAMDSLEQIVSGYEAGGSDYLVKPAQPDELQHKIKLAIRNKEARTEIQKDKTMAMETAMTAMTNASELGVVLDFMRQSFTIDSIEKLARLVIAGNINYGLESSVQFRTASRTINASSTEPMSPIEQALLSRIKDAGRLREKGEYFVVNFGCITMLIKNMPEDNDKRGRLRDHLAILIEGAETRLHALELEEEVSKIVNDSRESLQGIDVMQKEHKQNAMQIMDDVMKNLETSILSYGLTEEQEELLFSVVQKGVDSSLEHLDQGQMIDEQLRTIVGSLEQVTNR